MFIFDLNKIVMVLEKLFLRIIKVVRFILLISGILFSVLLFLSFTTLPFWGYHWLGTSKSVLKEKPAYIVFLGGGGMPSESNLIRAYYTVNAAETFPESRIIISIPGNPTDSTSTCRMAGKELLRKGIEKERIQYEESGTNTRSQAMQLMRLYGDEILSSPILIVTSPEHMRRAVMTFQKIGYESVNALPAFEDALEADLRFNDDELGGNKLLIPDVGQTTSLRYQFWTHLKYEILIAREMTALVYYRLRGWV